MAFSKQNFKDRLFFSSSAHGTPRGFNQAIPGIVFQSQYSGSSENNNVSNNKVFQSNMHSSQGKDLEVTHIHENQIGQIAEKRINSKVIQFVDQHGSNLCEISDGSCQSVNILKEIFTEDKKVFSVQTEAECQILISYVKEGTLDKVFLQQMTAKELERHTMQFIEFTSYIRVILKAIVALTSVQQYNILEALQLADSLVRQINILGKFEYNQDVQTLIADLDKNSQSMIERLSSELSDEIVDKYLRQKFTTVNSADDLKDISKQLRKITLQSDIAHMIQKKRQNIIQQPLNTQTFPNISWRLSHLSDIHKKESTQFQFKQFTLQLIAERNENSKLLISLRLLKQGGASEGVIDIEGCGILSFSFLAEVNEIKQTDRFCVDQFILQNSNQNGVIQQDNNSQKSIKHIDDILLLSLPMGNYDSTSKLELIVYLQFESVYSGLLNYSAICSKQLTTSPHLRSLCCEELYSILVAASHNKNQNQQQDAFNLLLKWVKVILEESANSEISKQIDCETQLKQLLTKLINKSIITSSQINTIYQSIPDDVLRNQISLSSTFMSLANTGSRQTIPAEEQNISSNTYPIVLSQQIPIVISETDNKSSDSSNDLTDRFKKLEQHHSTFIPTRQLKTQFSAPLQSEYQQQYSQNLIKASQQLNLQINNNSSYFVQGIHSLKDSSNFQSNSDSPLSYSPQSSFKPSQPSQAWKPAALGKFKHFDDNPYSDFKSMTPPPVLSNVQKLPLNVLAVSANAGEQESTFQQNLDAYFEDASPQAAQYATYTPKNNIINPGSVASTGCISMNTSNIVAHPFKNKSRQFDEYYNTQVLKKSSFKGSHKELNISDNSLNISSTPKAAVISDLSVITTPKARDHLGMELTNSVVLKSPQPTGGISKKRGVLLDKLSSFSTNSSKQSSVRKIELPGQINSEKSLFLNNPQIARLKSANDLDHAFQSSNGGSYTNSPLSQRVISGVQQTSPLQGSNSLNKANIQGNFQRLFELNIKRDGSKGDVTTISSQVQQRDSSPGLFRSARELTSVRLLDPQQSKNQDGQQYSGSSLFAQALQSQATMFLSLNKEKNSRKNKLLQDISMGMFALSEEAKELFN